MNTQDFLSNYYQHYDEEGRLLSRHGMVEYVTTMKYIEKYLSPDAKSEAFYARYTNTKGCDHLRGFVYESDNVLRSDFSGETICL